MDPPFTRCFLIENDPVRVEQLRDLEAAHPNATVIEGDLNERIVEALGKIEPQAATIAFLDPEGTELEWRTIEALARHKVGHSPTKIELLILFPLQMCVLRLLNFKTGRIPRSHARKLEAMLGAESPWREIWQKRLMGLITTPEETRAAFLDSYCHQIKRLGYRHVLAREVMDRRGRPLYYLLFASDIDAGKRIMRHEYAASREEQDRLFSIAPFTPGLIYDADEERPYRY